MGPLLRLRERKPYRKRVSIQLIAPASGAYDEFGIRFRFLIVSIQLIAPASGAYALSVQGGYLGRCFHSTDCPSKWGLPFDSWLRSRKPRQVSIQLIAPASGAMERYLDVLLPQWGFHSTDCPSKWGHAAIGSVFTSFKKVSIQLIAPASGAKMGSKALQSTLTPGFHSTDCPSKWGLQIREGL